MVAGNSRPILACPVKRSIYSCPVIMPESSAKHSSWIPHGFDYYPPHRTRTIRQISETILNSFHMAGYQEIRLPTFDYATTFRSAGNRSLSGQLFELRDTDGELLTIRPDLTVQVIKGAATGHFGEEYPLRVCYFQPVFRDIRWGSGRRREILQAGVELIGADSSAGFSEILELALKLLERLKISHSLVYSDTRFLNYLLQLLPDSMGEDYSFAFVNRDSRMIEELLRPSTLSTGNRSLLINTPLTFGAEDALQRMRELAAEHSFLLSLLDEAARIKNVVYDFSMAADLHYYTGPVFEVYTHRSNEKIVSGGVYNSLYSYFSRADSKNACGFAFNLSHVSELPGIHQGEGGI